MPLITRLVKAKNESVLVHFADSPSILLKTDQVLQHQLKVGLDLSASLLSQLQASTAKHNFFSKAVNFISYRPRSVHETRLRLKQLKATPSQIKDVIDKLIHYDYLNDQQFATWLVNSRLKRARHSPSLIKAELLRHHIDPLLITSLLSSHQSTSSQTEQAKQMLLKKFSRLPSVIDLKLRQKLFSFLIRKGFSYEIASSVIDEILKTG